MWRRPFYDVQFLILRWLLQNYERNSTQGFSLAFILESLPPLSYHENGRFYDTPSFCCFMEKYLLKEVDGVIRIVHRLLQYYLKNLTQRFFWTFISESSPPPSYRKNGWFYDTPPFCFFMEKYLLKEVVDFRCHD